MLMIKDLKFSEYFLGSRGDCILSIDDTGRYVIKVGLFRNKNKARSIKEEYEVIKALNDRGCRTCPTVYEHGTVKLETLHSSAHKFSNKTGNAEYLIERFVPSSGTYTMHDVLLTMLEQKSLGIYHGDIKPDNIRFDPKLGVCIFIDYDQAVSLTAQQIEYDNLSYMEFCNTHDKEKYGFGNWARHFGIPQRPESYLTNGALDLSKTSVFKTQKTTNSVSGIYHTIKADNVYALGSRTIDARSALLDSVDFREGERVLDVGCNAGLLSMYLSDRGCSVLGVDNDYHITVAAKVVSNILKKPVQYECLDLDRVDFLDKFDTIMLFSVFHHTYQPSVNGRKIADSCNRIIIETRLTESGKQPIDGVWVDTTRWHFQNLDDLVSYLESVFIGFKIRRNIGSVDKGRYILELVK